MASGLGSYGGTPTTVTNTVMKWTPTDRRGPFGDATNKSKDVNNQPRLLQPVTVKGSLTTNNGFTAANCRPGDMVVSLTEETNVITLNIRNAANSGWYQINISGTGSPVAVTSLEV